MTTWNRIALELPRWSSTKWYLLGANVLLVFALIILANLRVLPLDEVNFLFFLFVAYLFALYRPGWAFLFLVGLLPLEVVNLLPEAWGLALRPYQLGALVLGLALATRFFLGKFPFPFFRPYWFDKVMLFLGAGAFLALLGAPASGLAFKNAIVLVSFLYLYFLFRQYLQTKEDIRQTLPFFLGSTVVVLGYALWQNLREKAGLLSYNVMPGRPNAAFTESDWLGMFVVFVLMLSWVLFLRKNRSLASWHSLSRNAGFWLLFFFHVFSLLALILTVSRSAWLGAIGGGLTLLLLVLFFPRSRDIQEKIRIGTAFGLFLATGVFGAGFLVSLFHLTPFPLFDRAASTGTGLQTITVACKTQAPPEKIARLEELAPLKCEHIRLEEKEERLNRGEIVGETLRPDPTIGERKRIYEETSRVLREHALWGIGWGSIGAYLGQDESGAVLNASNAWLEVWLGSGLVGFLAFLFLTVSLLVGGVRLLFREPALSSAGLWVVGTTLALGIFNLFNSGVLLGFFFLYLAVAAALLRPVSRI